MMLNPVFTYKCHSACYRIYATNLRAIISVANNMQKKICLIKNMWANISWL